MALGVKEQRAIRHILDPSAAVRVCDLSPLHAQKSSGSRLDSTTKEKPRPELYPSLPERKAGELVI